MSYLNLGDKSRSKNHGNKLYKLTVKVIENTDNTS